MTEADHEQKREGYRTSRQACYGVTEGAPRWEDGRRSLDRSADDANHERLWLKLIGLET